MALLKASNGIFIIHIFKHKPIKIFTAVMLVCSWFAFYNIK